MGEHVPERVNESALRLATREAPKGRAVRCESLFEDAMGHRSYARTLEAALSDDPVLQIAWRPVTYDVPRGLPRSDRLFPLRVALNARTILSTLDMSSIDCLVLQTHWVATGGLGLDLPPYVVVTDATPSAYRAADGRRDARTRASLRSRPFHVAVRRSLGRARHVIALSQWTADRIVDDDGVGRERIVVVPPGVDLEMFSARPRAGDRLRVTFVGYDFERKGGRRLIEWAQTTGTTGWEVCLVSPQAPHHLPAGVVALRNVNDRASVAEVLGRSDVFVLPTSQDIVPVAIVEAMASGCAVVATSVGAIPELLDGGRCGALVDPESSSDLGHTLDHLVTDSSYRGHLAEAARARAAELHDVRSTSAAFRAAVLSAAKG